MEELLKESSSRYFTNRKKTRLNKTKRMCMMIQ